MKKQLVPLLSQLRRLEREAMAALADVKNSRELAAWRRRYITGGKSDGAQKG